MRQLLLSPDLPIFDNTARPDTRLACFENDYAMRHHENAEHLLRPRGRRLTRLTSLTIPFKIVDQDWSQISDLPLTPTVEFLAIDNYYVTS
jgi:hypothetical protein